MRRRLEAELVRRKIVADRVEARRRIEKGEVLVSGAPALNPQRWVSPAEAVGLVPQSGRFVSRGGDKLDAALTRFGLNVTGTRALDVGSSTGGFTDCLLQAGALQVTAVDVGTNQLDARLRNHPKVAVYEQTNIRTADPKLFREAPFDLVVADLSFISLTTVMPQLVAYAKAGGNLILLVKPQFESRAAEASAGRGVIRDPAIWQRTLREVLAAAQAQNATTIDLMESPLRGAKGNAEFLALLQRKSPEEGLEIGRMGENADGSSNPTSQKGGSADDRFEKALEDRITEVTTMAARTSLDLQANRTVAPNPRISGDGEA